MRFGLQSNPFTFSDNNPVLIDLSLILILSGGLHQLTLALLDLALLLLRLLMGGIGVGGFFRHLREI